MPTLNFELLHENFDYIMFLKFDIAQNLKEIKANEIVVALTTIYDDDRNTFVILTNRKEPPLYKERYDEYIYSFSCDFHHFRRLINNCAINKFDAKNLLFKLLDQTFNGNSNFKKILVKQIPIKSSQIFFTSKSDLIIPHRGNNKYLDNLLDFLNQLEGINVFAGIDQEITEELLMFKNNYPNALFYNFTPNPVGPYVIRNQLIKQGKSDIIFFQDSDDIPCADRFKRITDHMIRNNCQLCGSHEVNLNYFDQTVRAIRYPKNVMTALDEGPRHSLLHPTSAITRNAFNLCGKLSEERVFGNDTKFLLHSYFTLDNIRNIDEFLYIRRSHPGSLTASPDTNIDSPIRLNLLYKWMLDFELIKSGKLNLEDSSLKYEEPGFRFQIKTL